MPPASARPRSWRPAARSARRARPYAVSAPTRRPASARAVTVARGFVSVVAGDSQRKRLRRGERGLEPASSARQQPLDVEPELVAQRQLALERLGLVAVARDDERAAAAQAGIDAGRRGELGGERRPGARAAQARARAARARPASASVTGASIPAATCDAPPPSSPRSSTQTECPRCAARHATASPITPPPMTTTSCCGWILRHCTSLRRHDPDQLLTVGVTPSQPALAGSRSANARGCGEGDRRDVATMAAMTDLARSPRPPAARRPVPRLRPASRRPRARGRARARARRRRRHRAAARQAGVATTSCWRAPRSRAAAATRRGALLILNDRPELVRQAGADGCHVGQDDMDAPAARAQAGDGAIVGQSTHFPDEIDAATDADYIGVGPVYATPTKPGPARGRRRARALRGASTRPCRSSRSAGSTRRTSHAIVDAGARRIAVVRAITEAADPRRRGGRAARSGSSGSRSMASRSRKRGARATAAPRRGRQPPAPPAAEPSPTAPAARSAAPPLRPQPRARRGRPRGPRAARARRAPARRHRRRDRRVRLRDRQRRRDADRRRPRRRPGQPDDGRGRHDGVLLLAAGGMLARQVLGRARLPVHPRPADRRLLARTSSRVQKWWIAICLLVSSGCSAGCSGSSSARWRGCRCPRPGGRGRRTNHAIASAHGRVLV